MKLNEILAKIDENQQKIDGYGKFDPEILKKINYKFRLDWNYYSNSMEGNSLTKIETKHVMMDVAISGKSFKDVAEMRGHDDEVKEIFKLGKGEVSLSEGRIRDMHKAIMHEDDPQKKDFVGKWKTSDNYLLNHRGERIDFMPHLDVPDAMHKLLNKTNAGIDAVHQHKKDAPHPVIIAFQFHLEYIFIHPFYDGNGRTVRLLMNLLLIRFGFPPIVIKEKDREDYYKILGEIQGYGADPKEFSVFMGNLLTESQQLVLDALEGKDIEEEDDFEKEIRLIKSRSINQELAKSPKLVFEIFSKINQEIWPKIAETLNTVSELFNEMKTTHFVNNLNERFPTRSVFPTFEVSSKPKNLTIFGHDIYDYDVSTITWHNCLYGLLGSKKVTNFEADFKISYEAHSYKIILSLNYKALYQLEKKYNDLYFVDDVIEISKILKSSLLSEIKANR